MIGKTLGHYRIAEKIGAGGMGEVYRAHDEQLDRDVALKVLPVGTPVDESARKRFRKEALTLAKLNHPNIEAVHEFGSQEGVDFLVMELVRGATLAQRLKAGSLPEREALRLGCQVAEGLAAAHAQGVVHRDLKPGNLMLTPEGQLKILDFGLAALLRPAGDPDVTRTLTETQAVSGTLPYMSPEQLRGQPADARSDLYAAGTVLYETVTGRRPFPQSQSAELIGAILHQTPAPPSTVNRHITAALEAVILKALEKEPERRYQSARELLATLEGLSAGQAPKPPLVRWPILMTASAVLALVLVSVILGLNVGGLRDRLLSRSSRAAVTGSAPAAPIKARRSLAVLGFKNLSGRPDEAWLSTALSEMLTTELAAGGNLRTIPGENVSRMKIELSLPDADSYARDTLTRIRKNLGTDYVVLGSYLALGKESSGQVRLDLRLQDVAAGETIAAVSEKGVEAQLDDLVMRTGLHLREKLGVGDVSPTEMAEVRASLPSNPEAARLYSEGLRKLRVYDALAARDLLEKAVGADPNHALAHSALAAAWRYLGYDRRATDEAKKAFDLSANLSREDRLFIEGRYREATREYDKAIEIYRTLFSMFPDNLEYGFRLAAAQTGAGKWKDALNTVELLGKLPAPARDDARIDYGEAASAEMVGDYRRAQAAVARAVQKGQAQGAWLLVAKVRGVECRVFTNLGQVNQAKASCEEARRIYASAGDQDGVARMLVGLAGLFEGQGDLDEGIRLQREALATFRKTGDKWGMADTLNGIARVLWKRGDFAGAKGIYQESLPIFREIADKLSTASTLEGMAIALGYEGELAQAKALEEESLAIYRESGWAAGVSRACNNLGWILYRQGDLRAAKKMLAEALGIDRQSGNKVSLEFVLLSLADVLSAEGNIDEARQKAEESLAIEIELGAKGGSARSRLVLAQLSVEGRHLAEAETLARGAREEFRKEKRTGDEIDADTVLASALLAQGKSAEAQKEVDGAKLLVSKSQDRAARLAFAIAAGRVRAGLGNPAEGARGLRAALEEATKYGFFPHQLEARLALGEIEMKLGKTAAGRARLAMVEKDATASPAKLREPASRTRAKGCDFGAPNPSSFQTIDSRTYG